MTLDEGIAYLQKLAKLNGGDTEFCFSHDTERSAGNPLGFADYDLTIIGTFRTFTTPILRIRIKPTTKYIEKDRRY